MNPNEFLAFFRAVFTGLVKIGKKVLSPTDAYSAVRNRYQAQIRRPPPQPNQGFGSDPGQLEKPAAPPFPATKAQVQAIEYTDGIDYPVKSTWIAGGNFRGLGSNVNRVAISQSGALRTNKGDFTMIVIRTSYANPSGRYVYPNVPRSVMDQFVSASSKGKFYHKVLKYYSNRTLIGKRMRRTSRYLRRK